MQLADPNRQGVAPTAPTSAVPNSPLNAVANFGGSNASLGNPRAVSMGVGGFGSHPDLSGVSPEQRQQWSNTLSRLIYSVPAGGYVYAGRNYNGLMTPGSGFHGDPNANRDAASVYGAIGDLPTVANTSPALARFYASGGGSPAQGPSYNSKLGDFANGPDADLMHRAGFGPRYEGPFDIPGY